MAQSRRHHQTSSAIAAAVAAGLAVACGVWLLSLTPWYARLEGPALDLWFRLRPPIPVAPRIATIDIDTEALEREKAWPWPRSRHTRLLDLTSELGVRAIAFDIFFAEASPPASITRDEWFAKGGTVTVEDFASPDEDLQRAIALAGNVFLAQQFDFTGHNVIAGDPQKLARAEEQLRTIVQRGFALRTDERTAALFPRVRAPDAIPLRIFADAAKGVGCVQVREDVDGVIRHFPLLVRYDLAVEPGGAAEPCLFPSLPLLLACDALDVHLSELVFGVEARTVTIPVAHASERDTIVIPLNDDGEMLINWTGDWRATFHHVSYAAFDAIEAGLQLARMKAALAAAGPEVWTAGPGAVAQAVAPQVRTQDELRGAVQTLVGAHAYQQFLMDEPDIDGETAVRRLLGAAAANPAVREQQLAVFRNVAAHVAAAANRDRPPDVPDALWAQARRTVGVLRAQGGLTPADEPYYFQPPVLSEDTVVFAGRAAPMLQGATCFYGLTAPGTHDLRPTPVASAYPLLGVHPNLYNAILTGGVLREMPRAWRLPLLLVLAMVVATYAVGLGAARVLIATLGLLFVYAGGTYVLFVYSGWVADRTGPLLVIVGTAGVVLYQSYRREERARAFIRGAFEQYMNPNIVARIAHDPEGLKLGGEELDATAFFSDVAGFTTISESLGSQELVALLNEYLTVMTEIVFQYDGLLDKYEGDAIIAIFGAPVQSDDHAARACHASLDMQRRLAELREKWRGEGRNELYARIGLNSGLMTVGNMGSTMRFDYTMMGDTVNLASRLEGANKQYGTYLMCSEFTLERCDGAVQARELDLLRVKGKNEPVRVYEVYAKADEAVDGPLAEALQCYLRGVELYRARQFAEALEAFEAALALRPDDGPSRTYAERCRVYGRTPPPPDWDGVFVMTTK